MYRVTPTYYFKTILEDDGKAFRFQKIEPKYRKITENTLAYSGSTLTKSLECSGSITLKSDNFKAANEGSKLHERAEKAILKILSNHNTAIAHRALAKAIQNITIAEEPNHLDIYISDIFEDIFEHDYFGIETFLNVGYKGLELRGSIDFWAYCPITGILTITDLKTGAYPIKAENNKQLIFYAFLLNNTILKNNPITALNLKIFQSQEAKFDTFAYKEKEFEKLMAEVFQSLDKLKADNKEGFKFNAGKACKDCFKFSNCPAFLTMLTKKYEEYLKADLKYIQKENKKTLTEVVRKANEIKPYLSKLRMLIDYHYDSGALQKYMTKVVSKTTIEWDGTKLKDIKDTSGLCRQVVKTPNQMEKWLEPSSKRILVKDLIQYTYKPEDKIEEDFYEN